MIVPNLSSLRSSLSFVTKLIDLFAACSDTYTLVPLMYDKYCTTIFHVNRHICIRPTIPNTLSM